MTTEPQAQPPERDRLYEVVDPKSQFCGGIYKHRTSDSDVEYVRVGSLSAQVQSLTGPERLTMWICSHCQTPRTVGLTYCDKCHKQNHEVVGYVRVDLPRAAADDDALQDLFNLFERDSQGRWCFKSLSADASKLDKIMDRLATPRVETGLTVEAAGEVRKVGRQSFAAELLGQLDRITSTTAAYHLVKNLCKIELGQEPNSLGVELD